MVVNDLEIITEWIQEQICKGWQELKQPSEAKPGADYSYKKVEPTAWPVYMPSQERRLPEAAETVIPCVLVSVQEGTDLPKQHLKEYTLLLTFVIWNPGTHGQDIYTPDAQGRYTPGEPGTFKRNTEGWKDLYNFIDRAKRKIINAEFIGGLRVNLETGIKYGLVNTDDPTNRELYPYYAGYLNVTLSGAIDPAPEYLEKFL